ARRERPHVRAGLPGSAGILPADLRIAFGCKIELCGTAALGCGIKTCGTGALGCVFKQFRRLLPMLPQKTSNNPPAIKCEPHHARHAMRRGVMRRDRLDPIGKTRAVKLDVIIESADESLDDLAKSGIEFVIGLFRAFMNPIMPAPEIGFEIRYPEG